jgi:cytochrome c oxidase accessory protein FixG
MNKVLIDTLNGPVANEPQDLYSKRQQIYPKKIKGPFRTVKWLLLWATLGIYYLIPWLRWPRGEGIPDQAVLADFANEKFFFLWLEVWPQEFYYIAGLLILGGLGLFLVTALAGRVWCGYFCPQTVWTDLYIWVERQFEGDRAERMRRDKAPMSADKLMRKGAKHVVWLVIAFATGGAFILYFHDAPTIARTFFIGEAPLTAYFFSGILTFTTYMLAGTMREQVCTYLCPWPRIQGALTDEHALNVTYRHVYGEPRAPKRKGDEWQTRGGCIDCDQCVQVCPMGIDIRNGPQLECIHCALCIDACNQMMEKVGWPKRLIGYETDHGLAQRARGDKPTYHLIRPRTLMYTALMGCVGFLMVFGWMNRGSFEVYALKDRSPPFVTLSDGSTRNGYELKLVNKANETRQMIVTTRGVEGLQVSVIGVESDHPGEVRIPVAAHTVDRYRLLLTAPPSWTATNSRISVVVEDPLAKETRSHEVAFTGGGK